MKGTQRMQQTFLENAQTARLTPSLRATSLYEK